MGKELVSLCLLIRYSYSNILGLIPAILGEELDEKKYC